MHGDEPDYPSQFNCSTLVYIIGIVWVFVYFVLLFIELGFFRYLNLWAFVLAWTVIGIFFLGIVLPCTLMAQQKMDDTTPRIWYSPAVAPSTTILLPPAPRQRARPYETGSTALYISGGIFVVITSFVIWHLTKNVGECCSASLSSVEPNVLAVTNALFQVWLVAMIIIAYTFTRAAFANYYTSKMRKSE